ncbi:MAG: hypothetical protein ACP5MZ_02600 [Candidatus Micrarchaeia archaeon]
MLIKDKSASSIMLYSKLYVAAKPLYPKSIIRMRILSLPNAVQERHGTMMAFRLKQGQNSLVNEPILCLDSSSITLKFYFREPSLRVYRTNLAIFVSLLSYLSDVYEIDMKRAYPSIVEVVSGISKDIETASDLSKVEALKARIKELSMSNVRLSEIIFDLEAKSKSAVEKAEILQQALLHIMKYFSDREGNNIDRVIESMQAFGFSKEELQRLTEACGIPDSERSLHAHET